MIEFHYRMRDAGTGREIATGETKHIFLGPEMKPIKLPEKYYALFGIVTAT